MRRLTVATVAAVLVLSTRPAVAQDAMSPAVPSIVTHGDATVRRPADQSFVTAVVETRARNPRDAQQQNASGMAAVLQRLASMGLPKDALRTLGYTVQQEADFVSGRRVPRDFVARNAVEVRVDVIDRTGDIVDAVVQAGATSVDRIRFDVKDRVNLEREALRLAVEDARARADAAAAGAGRTVDRVLRIDDSRQPELRGPVMMAARPAAGDAPSTPIEAGPIEIRATVVLTVAIK
jgi:uncharacterized protein